ncbi:methyltransferase [Marinithermofilum abyssi]|uniref:Methyltransferase n=1 Tax=Marinithermofilum abyssi TaxID=1571185 RepID=A0A8J2VBY5_9BACL|nr:16S rRNA (guanine(966)-N(2))-methyltransferase RsmD [Marinithermofilum abyssi]GGE16697.1 methyltransferase [Marinithermofilum abyssi]
MRIIAGMAKGIRLKTVPGTKVRPTTDRVKESLFSVIGPFFDGGWVLDLFAGSGSLGLEALSRGAEHAVFVDQSRASIEVIRENIRAARMDEKSEVYRKDARAALRVLIRRNVRFRYIFLDPPYHEPVLNQTLQMIGENDLLEGGGVVAAEHASDHRLPEQTGELQVVRTLTYGDTTIDLYQQEENGRG